MRVRAKVPGYFGKRHRPGEEFDLPEGARPGSWMEVIGVPEPAPQEEPMAPTEDEIVQLRAKWKGLTGKKAFPGWGVEKLKENIAAFQPS